VQDPAFYLNEISVDVPCCVDSSRPALISDDYRVLIGFESFFFADSAALQMFLADITTYCGRLTDPVTLERFQPDQDSPTFDYNNRAYLFASAASLSRFEAMPEMYYLPNYQMLPQDSTSSETSTQAPH
jgi:hypothetical protein